MDSFTKNPGKRSGHLLTLLHFFFFFGVFGFLFV